MDPLSPIVPVSPNITPITPAPMVGGVSRDGARSGADQDKRRRRREPESEPGSLPGQDLDYAGEYGDDHRPHIDVTA